MKTYNYNEFNIFFQYINDEPSMVIGGNKSGCRRAWVIPLSSAWQYADSETGSPTAHLINSSIMIGELLCIGVDKSLVYKIASAIVDALPDLIKMPPNAILQKSKPDNLDIRVA